MFGVEVLLLLRPMNVVFKQVACVIVYDAWLVANLALKYLRTRQIVGFSVRSFTRLEWVAIAVATVVVNGLLLEMLILS